MADRRKTVRAVVRLEVEGEDRNLFRVPLYVTENLSRGGMFLITTNPLEEGTELSLRFSLPGEKKPMEFTGEVIWAREEEEGGNLAPGMGIRFLRIDEEDREHIGRFTQESSKRK